MDKEIEDWIENNCPTKWDNYGLKVKNPMWCKGATEMADYMQIQPPTKEQLIKAMCIYDFLNKDFRNLACLEFNAEQILSNWNDE